LRVYPIPAGGLPAASRPGVWDAADAAASDMERPRVLVLDDDDQIRATLRRALLYGGYEVALAATGEEALQAALEAAPDLAVLDVVLPGIDGLEVCRRLREDRPDLPIIFLTARDSVQDRVKGLDIGADDYVVKPFAMEELLARVRAHLRHGGAQAGQLLRYADLTLDTGTREALRGDRPIQLSTTQYELLRLFLNNPRQVLTRDIIMDRVWGYDFEGESNVLEVYISQIRHKLEERDESRLIHTVRGAGYALREDTGREA
jgi:two-component system response regulator MprA